MDVSTSSSVFMEGNVVESADIDLMTEQMVHDEEGLEEPPDTSKKIPNDTGIQFFMRIKYFIRYFESNTYKCVCSHKTCL